MTLTCQRCAVRIYTPRRKYCRFCATQVRAEREAAAKRALTPEERAEMVRIARIKRNADRPDAVCGRCRKPIPRNKAATCDKCCSKRNLQKRVAERARRSRLKAAKETL